jgi:hypothetical protein
MQVTNHENREPQVILEVANGIGWKTTPKVFESLCSIKIGNAYCIIFTIRFQPSNTLKQSIPSAISKNALSAQVRSATSVRPSTASYMFGVVFKNSPI